MSSVHRALLAATLVALLGGTARAGEVAIVGTHALSGTSGGRAFTGALEILPDATYRGERRFEDGAREAIAGRARIEEKELVLVPASSIVGALGSAESAARRFTRADTDSEVRWRFESSALVEVLARTQARESRLEMFARVARRGGVVAVLTHNRGIVDPAPGLEIRRSACPSPEEVVELQRSGVKTILSLNGPLDEEVRSAEHGRVNLGAFVRERLRHEFVSMGAKEAPTDEELVQVFKVLLDDSKKPILLHCRQGADRTGIIAALYQVELLGWSKERAKSEMRRHGWAAHGGTEIQGGYLDLYQPGRLRVLLEEAGVAIPARYAR